MEVEIKLNEEEFDVLMQFVFVGNYVINGIREGETRIKKYDDVAEKLYRLQYEVVNKLSSEDAEENEYADLRDWAYDSVHEYMDDYEKDVFREKLAKWIAWVNYPIIAGNEESLKKHESAEIEYLQLIKEKGVKFIQISAPKIDEIK